MIYVAGLESTPSLALVTHQYTLTISMTGSGTVAPAVGTHTYIEGTVVQLACANAVGSKFSKWTGDSVEDTASMSTQIEMDSDKDITVVFEEIYTLTINSSSGGTTNPTAGTVKEYAKNSVVTIKAIAQDGYSFAGWSGGSDSTSNTITITMDGDKTMLATFSEEAEESNTSKLLYLNTLKKKAYWNVDGKWTFFATIMHGLLSDLDKDHHQQYLNQERHGETALHALGSVVPHDSHKELSDIGTNTHAQIDSHIGSTSNPHSVTAVQAGAIPVDSDSSLPVASASNRSTFFVIPGTVGPPAVVDKLYYCRSTDGGTTFEWKEVSLV